MKVQQALPTRRCGFCRRFRCRVRNLAGEAGFAHTARPGEGDEADIVARKRLQRNIQSGLAPNQLRKMRWQRASGMCVWR